MKSRKRKQQVSPAGPLPDGRGSVGEYNVWQGAAVGLAALAVVLLAYGPALNGPFVFDDQALPFFSPGYAEQPLHLAIKGVRPLLYFSFWLNSRLAGTEPYTYHLFNLLFHFADSLLVFFIARKILEWAGSVGGRREWLAAFAGAVFLLHPVQTEAVSYVASRSETLSALFFYSAFALFLYRKSAVVSWRVTFGVLVLYLAAASTKEHTVTLPALLLLTDYFWNPGFSFQGIRRNWRLYGTLVVAGAAGAVLLLTTLRGSTSAGFGLKGLPWYDYFYTQWRALWVYFRLFVLPFGQNADYDYPISRGVLEHGAILGLAGLLLLTGCAVYYRKRWPVASYGFLGALILFAPTSSVVPILDAVTERRLYLPMAVLVLILVEFMRAWRVRRAVLAGTAVAALIVLAFLCYRRNGVWADDVALWEDTVAQSPHNSRAQFQLGVAYFQRGRCDAAARQYERAFRVGKPDERLLVDWALAEDCLNRPEQALDKLRQAAAIRPTAEVYANTGMIFGKQKQYAEALAALNKALELDARFDMAYFFRGNVYSGLEEFAKAAEDYQRAVAINPANDAARRGLARVRPR